MAAAALVELQGGTPQQAADACAIAIANQLGLVCDPVAGLVEIPCIKRNVAGVMIAFSAADMALAGIRSEIPVDECIDCYGRSRQCHASFAKRNRLRRPGCHTNWFKTERTGLWYKIKFPHQI